MSSPMFIMATFDTDRFSNEQEDWGCTVDNGTEYTVYLDGTYLPAVAGTIDDITYASAISDLASKLTTATGVTWTGAFNPSTRRFNLDSVSGFTRSFGSMLRKIFQFEDQDTQVTSQETRIGYTPFFIWYSKESGPTNFSEEREIDIPFREELADDGRAFGISHGDSSFFNAGIRGNFNRLEWTFTNEPQKNVFSRLSSSLSPYTWQAHMEHCRSFQPWIWFLSSTASVVTYEDREGSYRFLARNAVFATTPMLRGYYGAWDIEVNTRQLSRGTDFGQLEEIEIGIDP